MKRSRKLLAGLGLVGVLCGAQAEGAPQQAKDLRYGAALFEYYQGKAFEALTELSVAEHQGGIEGHGAHPQLVQGGLLLSYGLTREAKRRFTEILETRENDDSLGVQVSPESRSQAWFYLGKVFYLEGDAGAAKESLQRVDADLLNDDAPELYAEWLYLRDQLELSAPDVKPDDAVYTSELEEQSLWRAYIAYNQAVAIRQQDVEASIRQLQSLLSVYLDEQGQPRDLELDLDEVELNALIDRVRLSLGQLFLEQADYERALSVLETISYDSVFSDQALFQFSVAAAHLGQHGRALKALQTLETRELFSPWLQQVPYALGYLYEQLGEASLAYEAYAAAGDHYQQSIAAIEQESASLSENQVLKSLQINAAALDAGQGNKDGRQSTELTLGIESIQNDPYGRIRVQPRDFRFAHLLSQESFQLALRDLHELYKLRHSLSRWERQLASFDIMLETREIQRNARIAETREELDRQKVELWQARQARYQQGIADAVEKEDAEFFMTADQKEFKEQIETVYANLTLLPDDEDKAYYQQKIDRIRGYFDWWIQDEYGINRWRAQKQLRQLNQAMDIFNERHSRLEAEMNANERLDALAARMREGHARLTVLRDQLERALTQSRQQLMDLVRADFIQQARNMGQYLLASREAEARLADALYQQPLTDPEANTQSNSAVTESSDAEVTP